MNRYSFSDAEAARFPKMVVLAIGNRCDYQCPHCAHPSYRTGADYQPQDLDAAVFTRIVTEMGRYPWSALRLIAWGEPLLHPRLVDFVAEARRLAPRNPITFITNGHALGPARSMALMRAGLDLIEISIDAASPEHYRRVRPNRDPRAFERVEANVQAMLEQRQAYQLGTRIVVSFIRWPTPASAAELTRFRARWTGRADEVVERPLHSFMGTVPLAAPPPMPRRPCYALWARFAINPWGEASVCYNDWTRRDLLGDLHDPAVTIAGLWRGPVLEQRRREQCGGCFSGVCAGCRDFNPGAWERPYEEVIGRCQSVPGSRSRRSVS